MLDLPKNHIMRLLVILIALIAFPSLDGRAAAGNLDSRETYHVIMWVGDSAYRKPEKVSLFFQRLKEMGVNAAMVYSAGDPQPLLDNHFPYYVENLVNQGLCLKFHSQVQNWDGFITDWMKSRNPAALVRDYCLEDPKWRAWASNQVAAIVRRNKPHHPLAYDLRDELSTTISANPFDYDFSPLALEHFREWLKTQYPSLEALNREWQTQFGSWEAVRPFTTDQIKNRLATGQAMPNGRPDWPEVQQVRFDPLAARQSPDHWNFSPWADFRTYMDISLSSALDNLRQTAHTLDPTTPVGIEGTQMPAAFGGYDLWRLAQVLDWVEPYDIGNAREIWGSFMPNKPIVTTVFEKDTEPALRRLWHLLLTGDRGCIVWWSEDCLDWRSPDYGLTPKAKALAPVFQELTGDLARLFLRVNREYDPIAIHYSQPSIQVDWLLESCVDGATWLRRFSSYEADNNRMAKARNSWLKVWQDLGYTPRFVSTEQIEQGELGTGGYQVLVLPQSLALSEAETKHIRAFLSNGQGSPKHVVLSDGSPALFNEHGRLLSRPPLGDIFPPARSDLLVYAATSANQSSTAKKEGDIARYASQRLSVQPALEWTDWLGEHCPVACSVVLSVPEQPGVNPRTAVYRYRLGNAQIIVFERNIDYHMSEELKQAGGNQNLETDVSLGARFAATAHVYDLRQTKYLGETNQVRFTLDPWRPAIFALLPDKIPAESVLKNLLANTR